MRKKSSFRDKDRDVLALEHFLKVMNHASDKGLEAQEKKAAQVLEAAFQDRIQVIPFIPQVLDAQVTVELNFDQLW